MCLWTNISICQETMQRNAQQILQTSRCERRSMKCHFQPALASLLPTWSHILIISSDMNQRERTFRQPETASADIMTETESGNRDTAEHSAAWFKENALLQTALIQWRWHAIFPRFSRCKQISSLVTDLSLKKKLRLISSSSCCLNNSLKNNRTEISSPS